MLHHLVTESPVRTSALRGLGAMPNVFALECAIDELAARADDPVHRLITTDRARRHEGRRHGQMASGAPGGRATDAALPSRDTEPCCLFRCRR
jgi:hypothetical protein